MCLCVNCVVNVVVCSVKPPKVVLAQTVDWIAVSALVILCAETCFCFVFL